jgi:hypothetical protein
MSKSRIGAFLLSLTFPFAGPALADRHPPSETVELTGVAQYVAWAARTGEMLAAPDQNFCPIVEARLTRGPGFFLSLFTTEACGGGLFRDAKWDGMIGPDGRLAIKLPKYATMRFPDGSTVKAEVLPMMKEHSGCELTGTMPVYYGYFDGTLFHANGEFHGICTGGTMWGPMFGISEAVGPVHADFLISLEVKK